MKTPILRIGRLCGDFDHVLRFYRDGLGLNILAEFRKHAGFDGIVLGKHGAPYHLEFTKLSDPPPGRTAIKDDLLVFYLPDPSAWLTAVQRMRAAGFSPVPSLNPYWEWEGVTFEDPAGNRVVLHNAFWNDWRASQLSKSETDLNRVNDVTNPALETNRQHTRNNFERY